MQLTEHFTLEEFLYSATAEAKGIDNTPTIEVASRIGVLASEVEKVRQELGVPIIITSGYRCERLNKAVCGVSDSQHMKGEACDLYVKDEKLLRKLFQICCKYDFDQVLFERTRSRSKEWVHVSKTATGNRHDFRNNYIA